MLDNIIGTAEAAEILGLSPDHVKLLCRQGKIKSKRIGKTWVIDKTSLIDYKPSE
jgi:excisionase family DNA binding protein